MTNEEYQTLLEKFQDSLGDKLCKGKVDRALTKEEKAYSQDDTLLFRLLNAQGYLVMDAQTAMDMLDSPPEPNEKLIELLRMK